MQLENTRIYQRSLELVDVAKAVMEQLPTGYAFLSDQLKRAASSVVLNYAEGWGRTGPRERRRFFNIARASAHEVAAILDVAFRFGVVEEATHTKGKDVSDHVSAMLYRYR